jgi:hypothetical protein
VIDTRARFVAPLVACFGSERVTLVAGPLMTSRLVKFLRSQIGESSIVIEDISSNTKIVRLLGVPDAGTRDL